MDDFADLRAVVGQAPARDNFDDLRDMLSGKDRFKGDLASQQSAFTGQAPTNLPDYNPNEPASPYLKAEPVAVSPQELKAQRDVLAEQKAQETFTRKTVPGAAHMLDVIKGRRISSAMARIDAGEGTPADKRLVKDHLAEQERLAQRSLWEKAFDFATGAPVMAGEFALAGGPVGAAGRALGIKAASTGLGRVAQGMASQAARVPLVPSLYVEPSIQENLAAGRDAIDPAGFAKAVPHAMGQMAALGAVSGPLGNLIPGSGLGPAAARVGLSAATAPIVQQAVDTATSAVGLDSGYGTLGKWLSGEISTPQALEDTAMNAVVFATFGTIHELNAAVARMGREGVAARLKQTLDQEQAKQAQQTPVPAPTPPAADSKAPQVEITPPNPTAAPEAVVGPPETTGKAPKFTEPETPREKADRMTMEMNTLRQKLEAAKQAEMRNRTELSVGMEGDGGKAMNERIALQKKIKAMERELDSARTEAMLAETPVKPKAAPAAERSTPEATTPIPPETTRPTAETTPEIPTTEKPRRPRLNRIEQATLDRLQSKAPETLTPAESQRLGTLLLKQAGEEVGRTRSDSIRGEAKERGVSRETIRKERIKNEAQRLEEESISRDDARARAAERRDLYGDERGAIDVTRALEILGNRKVPKPPPLKIDKSRSVPIIEDWQVFKKVASEPRGLGKLGTVGKALDPRARATEPYKEVGHGYDAAIHLYDQAAKTVGSQLRAEFGKDAATWENERIVMADGTTRAASDVIKAELRDPGSQKLTPRMRKFIDAYKRIYGELKDSALAVGRPWADKFGQEYDPAYFPALSVETASGKQVLGRSTKAKLFPSEEAGLKAGVKYHENLIDRVENLVGEQGRLNAEYLLANDPALGGMSPGEWFAATVRRHKPEFDAMPAPERAAALDRLSLEAEAKPYEKDQPGHLKRAFEGKIYPDDIAKWLHKKHGETGYTAIDITKDVVDAIKVAKTGLMDVGFLTIQGQQAMFRSPVAWTKGVVNALKTLVTGKEGLARVMKDNPEAREAARAWNQYGGSLSNPLDFLEGTQQGSFLSQVPYVGKFAKRMSDASMAFFDAAKIHRMMVKLRTNPDPATMPAWVEAVENSMGLGRSTQIGVTKGARVAEGLAFFSPSYTRALLNQVGDIVAGSSTSRAEALKSLGALAAGATAASVGLMKLAGMSWDEIEDRMDPSNPKFGMASITTPDGKKQDVGLGGAPRAFFTATYKALKDQSLAPIGSLLRARQSGLVSLIGQWYSGKDYQGNDQTPMEAVVGLVTPTTIDQFLKPDGSPSQKIAGAGAEVLGLRTFPENDYAAYRSKLEAYARRFGKRYDGLTLEQQLDAVDEVGPKPSSEGLSATARERAVKNDYAREQELMDAISPEARKVLRQVEHRLPGYDPDMTIAGREVPLTKTQLNRWKEILAEHYNDEVKDWPVDDLKSMDKEERKAAMRKVLMHARARAKAQFINEFAPEQ